MTVAIRFFIRETLLLRVPNIDRIVDAKSRGFGYVSELVEGRGCTLLCDSFFHVRLSSLSVKHRLVSPQPHFGADNKISLLIHLSIPETDSLTSGNDKSSEQSANQSYTDHVFIQLPVSL